MRSWWVAVATGGILLTAGLGIALRQEIGGSPRGASLQTPASGFCYPSRTSRALSIDLGPAPPAARPRPPDPATGKDIEQLKREKEVARALAEGDASYRVNIEMLPFKGPGRYPVQERLVVRYATTEMTIAGIDISGRPTAVPLSTSVPILGDGVSVRVQTLAPQTRMWNGTAGRITVAAATADRLAGSLDIQLGPIRPDGTPRKDTPIHLTGSWECQISFAN